jgi:site-specific recombinase XerD
MKLQALIRRYINYKKSLGVKFNSGAGSLEAFCRFIGNNATISKISSKQITSFLYGEKQITLSFFRKHSALKGFYSYCISRGYTRCYPLPTILPKKPAYFIPYIYSHDELKRFFAATMVYQETQGNNITPYTAYVFFILLYVTGLRLDEAISLTMEDVDLSQSILTIKYTKFYKTRLVPFNKDLLNLLNEYTKHRKDNKHSQEKHAPFFISKKGGFLVANTIRDVFARICKKAGIKRTCRRPRIHDFRHYPDTLIMPSPFLTLK